MSLPLTIIILTQDEEENIRDCFESVKAAAMRYEW